VSSTDPEPDPRKRTLFNVDAAVQAYLAAGAPVGKLVVGVSFVGHGWEGVPNTMHGMYQVARGPAQGTWAKDGNLDYRDLAANYVDTYLRFWNNEVRAPWLYNPDTGVMITYDDPPSLDAKARYVASHNLAGMLMWQLAADDDSASLVAAVAAGLLPQQGASVPDSFRGALPYASELFGVYHPLVGWIGHQASARLQREAARNAAVGAGDRGAAMPAPGPTASGDRFIDELLQAAGAAAGVLSPVGLVHLYREYFFGFETFLGVPVGHVWLSSGGTVELVEVNTRKTTVEQTTEVTTETSRKSEESLTQQDDVADAVKEDNANNVKLGVAASGGGSVGVYHADASVSMNIETARHTSQEVTHKHSRTQSEKLSSEIRRNFKTTFRTVTETTDTTSRRYVVQNTSDKLVNYELRRKMRKVGVQMQHLGTRLAWQIYVDDPGRPLGLGEMVQVISSSSGTAAALKAPEPLQPQEKGANVEFALTPALNTDTGSVKGDGDDRTARHDSAYGIAPQGQPEPDPDHLDRELLHSYGNSFHIHGKQAYSATPPGAGYVLSAVRINKSDLDSVRAAAVVDDAAKGLFHIQVAYIWWKGKDAISFDLTLVWSPPAVDPAMLQYRTQLAAAQQIDYANAVRDRLKLVSSIRPRRAEDLRSEERSTVYGNVIQHLMAGSTDRHVTSELLRTIFDVDEMLYFVAPDFWRPHSVTPPTKYPPAPPPVIDPNKPPSLTGETVLSWYGWPDKNANVGSDGAIVTEDRNNYLITEETQPAPKGSSLGWLIQIDGDARRNEFLNSSWVKAVLPVRPGHEVEALAWLRTVPEGQQGLSEPYQMQLGDPPAWQGLKVGEVLERVADALRKSNTDMGNALAAESVFEHGFDPLEGGFKPAEPYQVFDQWLEVLPTDQVVAVAVAYDPRTGKEL
jgi:GH18 family chitinase